MDEIKELQLKIIYYKKKLKMKNKDISEKSGVPVDTISRICTGKTAAPKLSTIRAIAKAFDVPLEDLIGNEDSVAPYYLDKKTGALAQELKDNTELKILLDASKDLSPEDLQTLIGMVNMLKRN